MEDGSDMDQDRWSPWHPSELTQKLLTSNRHCSVVGSCALDLWHGKETRAQEDLEFCCLHDDAPHFIGVLKELIFTPRNAEHFPLQSQTTPYPRGDAILGMGRGENVWRVDLMIDLGTEAEWVFKRNPYIRLPRSDAISTTPDGIPFLRPAPILLLKAKSCRPKDQFDFETALPHLNQEELHWLLRAIEKEYPQSHWVAEIIGHISASRAK